MYITEDIIISKTINQSVVSFECETLSAPEGNVCEQCTEENIWT